MKEELVGLENGKLAKEKGFNWKCRGKIHISHWHHVKDNIIPSNIPLSYLDSFAPIKDWNNSKQPDLNKRGQTLTGLYLSLPTQALLQRWLREVHNIDVRVYRDYQFLIKDKNKGTEYYDSTIYDSYEKALEAGLQAALNLIK